uniref:Tubulin folding cofactor E like n=1 Tax=Oncorhynchus kisutch TaxID=8019 RepID=A0A8C7DNV8_ONCKI
MSTTKWPNPRFPAPPCACFRSQTTSYRSGTRCVSLGPCTQACKTWCCPTTNWALWRRTHLRTHCSACFLTCAASTSTTQFLLLLCFCTSLFPLCRTGNPLKIRLNRWEDIERLNFFPKLEEVRLMGLPLLQPYTNKERRSLTVAQLPSVSVLNGSVVTEGEREDAERFFIRHYLDLPEETLPHRYHVLVSKYGRLAPLAEVDLRPRYMATLEVRWGERTETLSLRLEQTVGELKKELRALVDLPANGMRLYYIARELGSALGPEEMKYGSRALHSYMIQDGDEILVVPKTKSRTISSTSLDS